MTPLKVLVVDDGDVLGAVTDRDLLRTMLSPNGHRRSEQAVVAIDDLWLHQPLELQRV